MKKKLIALGAVALLLVTGLYLASCDLGCDNNNQCKWEYREGDLFATNQTGGVCFNSKGGCVIFNSDKGFEAMNNQKDVKCNCR